MKRVTEAEFWSHVRQHEFVVDNNRIYDSLDYYMIDRRLIGRRSYTFPRPGEFIFEITDEKS